MPRSILSSLCFVLVPGLCLLGFYNIQTAKFHSHMKLHAEVTIDTLPAINFGSTVTLRHVSSSAAGYLHSHPHNYPTGSKQQQATLAPERSKATAWRVYNATANYETREHDALQVPRQPVVAGSAVKLLHVATAKHLHSHSDSSPPVSPGEDLQEVTAYGMAGFAGDANDDWLVEPVDGGVLRTMSPFRLQHRLTQYYLSSRGATLPEWGFGLQEVLCELSGSANDLWIIEEAV
ncbi:MIR motif-containing protein [Mycena leptocephala]|nr:MIR motif-containing protein [Mycena leptocephala]